MTLNYEDEKNLYNARKIFFIGIGGISMSGLAMILKHRGYIVEGSDISKSDITSALVKFGINVHIGHERKNITDDIDLVVYTAAVKEDNEELLTARMKNKFVIPRSKLLGIIMDGFNSSVAVSGTHGKTTTTSMISQILLEANLDPTITVGGVLPSINGNTRVGNSGYFVAEACEYKDSFLEFYPYVGVILNMDLDHIDYFKSIDDVRRSFAGFISNIKDGGLLVINNDIDDIPGLITQSGNEELRVITFGTDKNANWYAKDIEISSDGLPSFEVLYNGFSLGRISLKVPGKHNIYNSLSAMAVANDFGVNPEYFKKGLGNFSGAKRRFEYKGEYLGVTIIDDYAHHPAEVKATLKAAREHSYNNIWCVFQPHTYSRTKAFLNEFAEAFSDADHVILSDIYAAREVNPGDISASHLKDKIINTGQKAVYINNFSEIEELLKANCKPGDLIITMGAGDVYRIGENIVVGDKLKLGS